MLNTFLLYLFSLLSLCFCQEDFKSEDYITDEDIDTGSFYISDYTWNTTNVIKAIIGIFVAILVVYCAYLCSTLKSNTNYKKKE